MVISTRRSEPARADVTHTVGLPSLSARSYWVRRRWISLSILAGLVAVSFGTMFYAYSVLITDEAAGSRFSTTALSTAYGGFVLVGGLLAVVIGRAADRYGVRPLVLIGSVLGGGGLLAVSVASEPWQVIGASWILLGPAGAMTFYEPAFVAVDQWFGPDRRGPAIAALTVIGGLAGPIFLPLTGFLVDSVEWRPATRVLALTLLAAGLATAAALPAHRGRAHARSASPRLRSLMGDRRFMLFTLSTVLSFGAFQAVFFHRIAVFEEAGFSVGLVAVWAGIASLLSFPGRFGAPLVRGRFGGLWLYGVLALALAAATAVMVVADTTWLMVTHFVVFGLAFGGLLPLRAVVMGRWFSGANFGSIMGAQWSFAAAAGAIGPWLVGSARDIAGGYDAPIALVAVVLAASSALALLARASSKSEGDGG